MFVIVVIQDIHGNRLRFVQIICTLRAVRSVPALQPRIDGCSLFLRVFHGVAVFPIERRFLRHLIELNDRADVVGIQNSVPLSARTRPDEPRDMIAVRMGRNDVFEHSVRAVRAEIVGDLRRVGLVRTRIDEHLGVADLDERAVAARLDRGRDKVNGEICRGDFRNVSADHLRTSARSALMLFSVNEEVIARGGDQGDDENHEKKREQLRVFFGDFLRGARRLF